MKVLTRNSWRNGGKVYAYFGHHKCASTWIHRVLGNIFQDSGFKYDIVYRGKDFHYDLEGYVRGNQIDFLSYTNANHKYVSKIEFYKGFHVIRDPRDVVVSGYFSHLYSHPTDHWPELIPHRKKLQSVSKEKGLLIEMDFEEQFFEHMYTWNYNQENVLELKMEHLVSDPYRGFLKIFEFLDLLDHSHSTTRKKIYEILVIISNKLARKHFPITLSLGKIPGYRVLGAVFDNRFSRLTGGRARGQENVRQHFRKGTPGDWRNHFNKEHIEYFKNKYNELLLKLGYEDREDW